MGRPRDYYRSSKTIGDCGAVQSCCNPPADACEFGRCCFQVNQNGGYCQHTRKDECDFFPGGYFMPGMVCSGYYGIDEICWKNDNYEDAEFVKYLPGLKFSFPHPRPNPAYPAVFLPKTSGCTCTPKSCFVSGVKVKTPEGYQNIENINIGDLVTTPSGVTKVSGLTRPVLGDRKLISLNDSDYFFTEDHPIKTPEGFKAVNAEMSIANYDYVDVIGDLKVGDWVITEDGSGLVEKIDSKQDEYHTPLYDLELEEFHEYYTENYLFHNCIIKPQPRICWSGCDVPYLIEQDYEIFDRGTGDTYTGTREILIKESGCYPLPIYCDNIWFSYDLTSLLETTRLDPTDNIQAVEIINRLVEIFEWGPTSENDVHIDCRSRISCRGKCCGPTNPNNNETNYYSFECDGRFADGIFNPETDGASGCPVRNPPYLGACCSGVQGTLDSCFYMTFEECKQANDANGTLNSFNATPEVYFHPGEFCFQNPCGIQEGCCISCTTLTQVYINEYDYYYSCDGITKTDVTGAAAAGYCSSSTGGWYNGTETPKGICYVDGVRCDETNAFDYYPIETPESTDDYYGGDWNAGGRCPYNQRTLDDLN